MLLYNRFQKPVSEVQLANTSREKVISMTIPTIDDVAAAAGVSKATVSRVMNGDYVYIRKETRQRVEEAIASLGYRPSSVARSLTSKRTQTIGMMISDVGNPFYSDVIHGVEDVAIEQSYNIFLGNTNYDLARGMALVKSFIDRRVDGVLIMSSSMSDEWLEELTRAQVPVVVLDWEVKAKRGNLSAISVDYRAGIQGAAEHLIGLGHANFAHISGPAHLQTARDRRDAFLDALEEHGTNRSKVAILESNLTIEGGRQAVQKLLALSPRPSAVFTANDLMAIGILSEIQSSGVKVPEDLSIIGLDDIWLAAQTEPPLTTVALPRYDIGSMAVNILFELLNRSEKEPQTPILSKVESSLVVRASTGRAPTA
jgi:LacI family transcriptional regulator